MVFRAEKDRAQAGSELNDLRAAMDHLSGEKVPLNASHLEAFLSKL
jgi:hypothetical protein